MIAKISRGFTVGKLLRYLMGPGRANEHVDQRVIATWDGAPELHQPLPTGSGCGFDVRDLIDDLTDPALAGRIPLTPPTEAGDRRRGPVWHCSLRNHPDDRELSDAEWTQVVEDLMDRTGIRRRDDLGGCRWVAVRHAPDHIHIAAMLVRLDNGRRVHPRHDYYRAGEVCRDAEQRFGLTSTAPADRTAARPPTRAEFEKAERRGRPETSREWLRRQARTAAVQAQDPEEFFGRLHELGALVRARQSPDGQLVGYAVAAPGDVDADGQPVWFGGCRLAPDLSLPALLARWHTATPTTHASAAPGASVDWDDRAAAVAAATDAVQHARAALHDADDVVGSWIAHATADLLTALCTSTQRTATPLQWAATDQFDRAARTPQLRHLLRQPQPWAHVADELRCAARALAAVRTTDDRDDDEGMAELLMAVAILIAEIAAYHEARRHHAQAAAARRTCRVLPRDRPRPERVQAAASRDPREAATHPALRALRAVGPPTPGSPPRSGSAPGGSAPGRRPTPPVRPRPPDTGPGRSR